MWQESFKVIHPWAANLGWTGGICAFLHWIEGGLGASMNSAFSTDTKEKTSATNGKKRKEKLRPERPQSKKGITLSGREPKEHGA